MEQVAYSAFEGSGNPGDPIFFDMFIDYHYSGMLVPEPDTLLVDAYFEGGAGYAPQSLSNTPQDGKGRIRDNVQLRAG